MWIVKFFLYAVAVLSLPPILAWIFGRLYKIDRRADVIHYKVTPDGWYLALHEYRPAPGSDKKPHPVLICHGLGGNHVGFDFQDGLSMARYLAGRGHHVFLLDLRGAGDSEKVGLCEGKRLTWDFDTYIDEDIPTAIEGVRAITGADKIHYIGHSMGGMLGYAIVQTPHAQKLCSMTAICSPGDVNHFKPFLAAKPFLARTRRFYLQWITKVATPLFEKLRILQKMAGNENLREGHYALAAANLQDDIPVSLLLQFGDWAATGKVRSKKGEEYFARLGEVNTPALFFVGENDTTVPPVHVKGIFDAFGSSNKKYHPLGRSYGSKGSYNHMSPLIGRDAPEEVYPVLADWLENGWASGTAR